MTSLESVGRLLLIFGAVFLALGGLLILAGRAGWSGRLPGDIRIDRESFSFYFPLATCILLSVILTLLLNLFRHR